MIDGDSELTVLPVPASAAADASTNRESSPIGYKEIMKLTLFATVISSTASSASLGLSPCPAFVVGCKYIIIIGKAERDLTLLCSSRLGGGPSAPLGTSL